MKNWPQSILDVAVHMPASTSTPSTTPGTCTSALNYLFSCTFGPSTGQDGQQCHYLRDNQHLHTLHHPRCLSSNQLRPNPTRDLRFQHSDSDIESIGVQGFSAGSRFLDQFWVTDHESRLRGCFQGQEGGYRATWWFELVEEWSELPQVQAVGQQVFCPFPPTAR